MPNFNELMNESVSATEQQTQGTQQLSNLQATGMQALDARIGAAITFVIESLLGQQMQQDARNGEQTEELRDPANFRSAAGLDATQTAALNDVTQTVSAEHALDEEKTADNNKAFDDQMAQSLLQGATNPAGNGDLVGEFREQLVNQAHLCVEQFQRQLENNANALEQLNDGQMQGLFRSLIQDQSAEELWQAVQQQAASQTDLNSSPVAAMIEQLRDVNARIEQVCTQDAGSVGSDVLMLLDTQQKNLAFNVYLALSQMQDQTNEQQAS
jgi:hypothetical protein